jgi:CRISPR-associated protein Cas1
VDRPLIALARENWEKISERKELYRVFTESVDGGEVLRQARRLANAIVDGEQYKPFVSK